MAAPTFVVRDAQRRKSLRLAAVLAARVLMLAACWGFVYPKLLSSERWYLTALGFFLCSADAIFIGLQLYHHFFEHRQWRRGRSGFPDIKRD